MSTLREAAEAVVDAWDRGMVQLGEDETIIAALRAAIEEEKKRELDRFSEIQGLKIQVEALEERLKPNELYQELKLVKEYSQGLLEENWKLEARMNAADKARGTPEPFGWAAEWDGAKPSIPVYRARHTAIDFQSLRRAQGHVVELFPLYRHPPAADGEQGEPAGDAITTLRAIRDRHLEFVPRPTESGAPGVGWYDDPENWRPKGSADSCETETPASHEPWGWFEEKCGSLVRGPTKKEWMISNEWFPLFRAPQRDEEGVAAAELIMGFIKSWELRGLISPTETQKLAVAILGFQDRHRAGKAKGE